MSTTATNAGTPNIEVLAEATRERLRQAYFADDRPWVVAYSGGKDSTLVLQLVYEVLLELRPKAKKPVYVISSDTKVEAPKVVAYVEGTLARVGRHAAGASLELQCSIVRPLVEEGFWAKLIGKGYPPPTRWFRWCTTSMKIKPARRRIEEITRHFGSVVLMLGSRKAESSARRTRMDARTQNAREMNPHHEIPNAFVMAPIADWSNDEVWEYLFEHNPPPWGGGHDEMLTLYRQASGGECPVVVDLTTPSCGGSRFGCWTCTVVKVDRSMQGFIDSGEEWMTPLVQYRNWLKNIREQDNRRLPRRRDDSEGLGPFDGPTRTEMLERLLEAEKAVGISLIEDEDILHIQDTWSREFDLRNSAVEIAKRYSRKLCVEEGSMPLNDEQKTIVDELIKKHDVSKDLVEKIFELANEYSDLAAYGSKTALRGAIKQFIETAARAERPGSGK